MFPPLVAAQLETARAADKARRKLELDLAAYQGRELYQQTPAPAPDGIRRLVRRATGGSLEELRALATTSRRSRRPFSWPPWPIRPRSCWRRPRMPGWTPARR